MKKNDITYLKDCVGLDNAVLEVLLDYFGNEVTVEEIEGTHFRGVLFDLGKNLASWQVAQEVIERARRGNHLSL